MSDHVLHTAVQSPLFYNDNVLMLHSINPEELLLSSNLVTFTSFFHGSQGRVESHMFQATAAPNNPEPRGTNNKYKPPTFEANKSTDADTDTGQGDIRSQAQYQVETQ